VDSDDWAREGALRAAELWLWTGAPDRVLPAVERVLAGLKSPGQAIFSGSLLTLGMRACADQAERAAARQDETGRGAARTAAENLAGLGGQLPADPFAPHPFAATVPAEQATFEAERGRLDGNPDPAAWHAAAKAWEGFAWPHRAGYAWWRCAQARLAAGQDAASALRAAAAMAKEHAPLLAEIRALALRARITLDDGAPPRPPGPDYGLTTRELLVLRLLAAGRTNAQIGAELYISPKTASVHVSNILRKLNVSGRAQAAATAERAGLLSDPPTSADR
jgi:DNA-binding CsgD family transcriptional regulator